MSVPVLVVTNAYPDFPDSYHGIFVKRIAESMAGDGWFSHVLAPRIFPDSAPAEQFPTHHVTRIPFPTTGKLLIEYERIPVFRIAALIASGIVSARRIIRRNGCRLVHAHWAFPAGLIALSAAKLSGLPLLLTVHGSDWRMAAARRGMARRAFLMVTRASGGILSVSPEISQWMAAHGIDSKKISTHPVGVDLDIFGRSGGSNQADRKKESVISTRNLSSLYQVGDLLAAVPSLRENHPGLSVSIAGDGPLRRELEDEAQRRGLADAVTFHGRLSQLDLAAGLAGSAVYVSTSPAEGTSISLLEAMASGCLPVVTDIPANRDWITHGENGLLFAPGNSGELASCLELALGDEELRRTAAARGPELVAKRGSFAGHVGELSRLYASLAGE